MLPRRDAEAVQIQAVSIIKYFIQTVTQLHTKLLTPTAFKLWCGIGWAETEKHQKNKLIWDPGQQYYTDIIMIYVLV